MFCHLCGGKLLSVRREQLEEWAVVVLEHKDGQNHFWLLKKRF